MEDSAYGRLKAAKRPGESFSEVVHRLLGGKEPSFLDFHGILDPKAAGRVGDVIAKMKEEDIRRIKKKFSQGR